MTLDAGDTYAGGPNRTTTLPSDGSGGAGDLVELSGGQVTQMAAGSTGTVYGILTEDSPSAGEDVTVGVQGKFVANADSGTTVAEAGISGTNAGQVASGTSGNFIIADEGGDRLASGTAAVEMR